MMGRKSLYSTEEERKEAQKHKAQERAQTEVGKELRSAQNRRAYERRRPKAELRLRYQHIPSFVHRLTAEPISITTQSLFDTYFYSKEPIADDDDFSDWEYPPPYFVSEALLELGLEDTIDALHGHRMRLQHDREEDLVVRYEDENRDEMWKEVHLDIFRWIGEAKALKKQLDEIKRVVDEHCIHYVMGLHLLRWKSHAITAYSNYWKIIRDGTAEDLVSHFVEVWFNPPTTSGEARLDASL